MTLPVEPPIEPMLAKLESEIPRGPGWVYEPKWDGFRAIVFRDGAEIRIGSRGRKFLERYFPELLPALREALARVCVVDGEIVLAGAEGLDFDLLQLRLHPAESRVRLLAGEIPASFVAFDLLAHGTRDLRGEPLAKRWSRLERMLGPIPAKRAMRAVLTRGTRVVLTPRTEDPDRALRWFDEFEQAGLDGVIAKRTDLRYVAGKRVMVKVKRRRTIECVVGGYRESKEGGGVGSVLLGLYDDEGTLHFVGHTSSFSAAERRAVLGKLKPLEGGRSFGEGRTPGGPSRWTGKEKDWVPVEPRLVCEVAYDHFQSGRFRHAATFLRWRPDRDPRSCRFSQAT